MRLRTLYRRSLRYHWRAHLAVALGVVAGTAALTGALLVGDALRGSLRDAVLGRLGRVTSALVAPRLFRQTLAETMVATPAARSVVDQLCPVLLVRGSAASGDARLTAAPVSILGVDERFWSLAEPEGKNPPGAAWESGSNSGRPVFQRMVVLNEVLAGELGVKRGEDILLRIGNPAVISPEMLLGGRSDAVITLRLTVDAVIPAEGLGAFGLNPAPGRPKNAYVPLLTLQRALHHEGRVNALLAAGQRQPHNGATSEIKPLTALLRQHLTLADVGLQLRPDAERGYLSLESDALLLEPALEHAARAAAVDCGANTTAVLAYLANSIAVTDRPATAIPYSVVAAVEPLTDLPGALELTAGGTAPELSPGEILLNDWAAGVLQAAPGDHVRLAYYVVDAFGRLRTEQAAFELWGMVRLTGSAADPGFAPDYPGVTDARTLADWNPPFPVDLRSIRRPDEDYWDQYRTTPKAFMTLSDGQRLWTTVAPALGRLTALRVHAPPPVSLDGTRAAFERALLQRIDPAALGFVFSDVRRQAEVASEGATDFGTLFLGFSMFLIVSAALLVALLYRLGVERRAAEIGLLLAIGFPPRRVARLLLVEGLILAGLGSCAGLMAARGYARLMLAGLSHYWPAAVPTPPLRLHETATSYVLGYVAGVVIAGLSIAWSLRGLTRQPARVLLAGAVRAGRRLGSPRAAKRAAAVALASVLLAGTVTVGSSLYARHTAPAATHAAAQSSAFFGGGVALLMAGIACFATWLYAQPRRPIRTASLASWWRLGVRNARRRVGRSLLTAGLIAAATFVITALQALRLEAPPNTADRASGTGGFALLAESAVPLPYDLGTPDGRAQLNASPAAERVLAGATLVPLRVQAGDDTSCLNLYRPTRPRVLGAPAELIARGGFTFAATLAQSESERRNPWTLLHRRFPDGAIPVIGDEASVVWQLHHQLGDDLLLPDQRGDNTRLRIVALLKDSFLQGELIIAESDFTRLFPATTGHALYLVDVAADRAAQVRQTLESELAAFGLVATSTAQRLAELLAVQNTYLATFQILGGLGLLLGTAGLAAVLLRNVWERRSELALLQAVGFSRGAIGWLVLSENAILLVAGLAVGLISAAVVVVPHALGRSGATSWPTLLLALAAVLLTGMLAGLLALIPALRTRLLPALRSE